MYWVSTRLDPEPGRVAEIIDRVASECKIYSTVITNAHRVRQYRNGQVHDNREEGEVITVEESRKFMGEFLGRLPVAWIPPSR